MEAKLQALKVPELKKLLQDANLPVSGTKAELIKRLLESPNATTSLGGGEEEDLLGEYEAEAPAVEASKAESAAKAPSAVPAAAPATTTATKKEGSSTPAAAAAAPVEKSEEDQKAVLIAELEKRIARAKRYGLATEEAEKQLERAIKFGVESTQDKTLSALDGGLKGGKRREEKAEKKATPVAGPKEVTETANKKGAEKTPVPAETEEEKAARIARQEADEAAKKRRAERFGLSAPSAAAATPASAKSPSVDPAEEEKKRKRMEKFATASAEPADKKVKA